ncbi:ABC transporter substrate-binding protein [Pseudonocardia kunmingensis]|uniref:ABC transporter substrate-binding protein n=1 Tax=Pseudonocardia kunmingensis TaxID=630975 RepID=UPI001150891C|nr:ABC transporter substrate-binding protein [Pseudonocardia kunmingensis]
MRSIVPGRRFGPAPALVPALVAALIAAIGLTGCGTGVGPGSASAEGPLRIGLLLELSGPAASFGVPERDGAQILADEINREGGVRGRQLELSVYDTAGNTTRCARGASDLIRREQVVAIIGGTTGSCTLAAAPVAERNKIPMLAPNGTIQVTDPANSFFPWVFRSQVSDLETTKAMFDGAAGAHSRLGLFFQQDAYGKDTADYVRNVLAQPTVTIAGEASAPLTVTDVASQATQLRNAAPDAVLLQLSSAKLGAAFTHAAQQVGLEAEQWVGNGIGTRVRRCRRVVGRRPARDGRREPVRPGGAPGAARSAVRRARLATGRLRRGAGGDRRRRDRRSDRAVAGDGRRPGDP